MTCRHGPRDPNCTAWASSAEFQREKELLARTPDPDNFEVMDAAAVGSNLILKVRYESCMGCAYDAQKVLVYLDTSTIMALKWKRIDPHFDDKERGPREAPSPDARFPASSQGWQDAIDYAESKT